MENVLNPDVQLTSKSYLMQEIKNPNIEIDHNKPKRSL